MAGKLYTPVNGVFAEPAKYGLLNSKTVVAGSERFESGIDVDSILCKGTVRNIEVCDPSNEDVVTEPSDTENQYLPFVVQAEFKCSTFGFTNADYELKATEAMELVQSKAVEHELWTGALSKLDTSTAGGSPNKYLASPDAVDVTPTGGAVSVQVGLALLEGALNQGYRGFIHGNRAAISLVSGDFEPDGDVLKTDLGNTVIAGSGYGNTGPDGSAATGTQTWLYATGPVEVHLSDIETTPANHSEAVDTKNNTVTYTVSRFAAPVFDGCGHFAVLVDLTL